MMMTLGHITNPVLRRVVAQSIASSTDRLWASFDKKLSKQEDKLIKVMQGYFTDEWKRVRPIIRKLSLPGKKVEASQSSSLEAVSKKQTQAQLAAALKKNQVDWKQRITATMQDTGEVFGSETAIQVGFQFPGLPAGTSQWLTARTSKLADYMTGQINRTTLNRLMDRVMGAVKDGLSVDELEAGLYDTYKLWDRSRPPTIARTELGFIASETQQQVLTDLGVDAELTWITARDQRVRPDHRELEGRTVRKGEVFGHNLRYPRDRQADADQVINCRCSVKVKPLNEPIVQEPTITKKRKRGK